MNATITRTAPSTSTESTKSSTKSASLWRAGVRSGLIAAAAVTAIAALATAAGVAFESEPGKAIPPAGFGQLALICTAVGVGIAKVMRSRARRPRSTFTRTAMVLTAVSCVPDLLISVPAAAVATLMLTHVVAAAVVIPALAARLPEEGRA